MKINKFKIIKIIKNYNNEQRISILQQITIHKEKKIYIYIHIHINERN